MRHLIFLLGFALVAGVLAASAAAQAPAQDKLFPGNEADVALAADAPAAPAAIRTAAEDKPFPGTMGDVFLYVDVVNGNPKPPAVRRPKSCTQLSSAKRGERPVFRIYGVETGTGEALTTENVKYAYVKIPGMANVKLNWGPHGSGSAKSWFWSAGFDIAADYPLGVLPFKVVFKTESGTFGIFTQDGLPPEYRLTILPA